MLNFKYPAFILIAFCISCEKKDANHEKLNSDHNGEVKANIVDISVTGNEDNYTFFVTVKSPDTGCEQYADWWEVIGENGELIYRRILLHSHAEEQPFKRSGGPVQIKSTTNVWVQSHMNNTGYGGETFYGSVADGFNNKQITFDFLRSLETADPRPTSCAF